MLLQQSLPGGVIEQVIAAYHMGNALQRIIHYYGELIAPKAIAAAQDNITQRAHVALQGTVPLIVPVHDGVLGAKGIKSPGHLGAWLKRAAAAPAGV